MRSSSTLLVPFTLSLFAACSAPLPAGNDAGTDARADVVITTDVRDASNADATDVTVGSDATETGAVDVAMLDVGAGTDVTSAADVPDAGIGGDGSTGVDASDVTSQPDASDVRSGGSCGGRGGGTCAADEFCSYALADICGRADATGTCTPMPTVCPDVVMPVCGCDGVDYSNECEANRAGTSVSTTGMCPVADCRTTGCPSGEYCTVCWVGYACIPVGAVC
jgi:hypothetical protein